MAAEALLFDAFVANTDRHPNNLALDMAEQPPRLILFDHGHALFGDSKKNEGAVRLKQFADKFALRETTWQGENHCLLGVIDDDKWFAEWLERIESLPDYLLRELASETRSVGASETEAKALAEFLTARRGKLRKLLSQSRDEFSSINSWSLFP